MKPYLVVSPEYGVMDVICDGQGPIEYGSDWVFVEAENARDARALGVHLFRKMHARYLKDQDNPFEGIKIYLQTCQAHGKAIWNHDHFECPECEVILIKEWEEERG